MKKDPLKIAYVAAGAAGMYCGSCLHDNTLASALMKRGQDVALIPIYTPMRTDEKNVSMKRVFFGGLNVYFQQKSSFFRKTPWFLDRLLDSNTLLKVLSRFSISNDAKELGELSVSMLRGENGHQNKELEKLITWLRNDHKPDILQIAYTMLIGIAPRLKRELNVPIICGMQGEDIFIEGMREPYRSEALDLIRANTDQVDMFVATSDFYANFMVDYLDVDRSKIRIVRLGINLDGFEHTFTKPISGHTTIGCLSRICPEKGIHLLVEAFKILSEKYTPGRIRLKIAGYLGKGDRKYLQELVRNIRRSDLDDYFDYVGEVDRSQKIDFLKSLDIFSMPAPYRDPKGLSVLEAMAAGVPVVQPDHGVFPEMINLTGGGVLFKANSVEHLVEAIESLMVKKDEAAAIGKAGREVVLRLFNDDCMADATLDLYREVAGMHNS